MRCSTRSASFLPLSQCLVMLIRAHFLVLSAHDSSTLVSRLPRLLARSRSRLVWLGLARSRSRLVSDSLFQIALCLGLGHLKLLRLPVCFRLACLKPGSSLAFGRRYSPARVPCQCLASTNRPSPPTVRSSTTSS
jgi:hypothetical protein